MIQSGRMQPQRAACRVAGRAAGGGSLTTQLVLPPAPVGKVIGSTLKISSVSITSGTPPSACELYHRQMSGRIPSCHSTARRAAPMLMTIRQWQTCMTARQLRTTMPSIADAPVQRASFHAPAGCHARRKRLWLALGHF